MHLRVTLLLSIVFLVTALCSCTQTSTRQQSKLAFAQHAHIRDATLNITYQVAGGQLQGTAQITEQPLREELAVSPVGSKTVLDIVTDGSFAYARVQGDKLWGQLNNSDDSPPVNLDADLYNVDQLSNAILQQDTLFAGVPAWHLHATFSMGLYDPIADFVKLPGTEDLWIRQSDGFPLREVKNVAGTTLGSDGTNYTLSYNATYDFTAWNTGITISIPGQDQIAPSG